MHTRRRLQRLRTALSTSQPQRLSARKIGCMQRVLRRLGHITAEGVLTSKGRFACHVTTVDELLATEVVFGGVLEGLGATQASVVLSCLVSGATSSQALLDVEAEQLAQQRARDAGPLRKDKKQKGKKTAPLLSYSMH